MTEDIDRTKVLTETRERVLIITINRPDSRNAVDGDVWFLIGEALEQAQDDADVRCIVLTGSGDLAFSAGMDLKALATGSFSISPEMARYGFGGFVRHFTSKPTIAAVNGKALGGGTELALACDLIVAVESAGFGLPEVKRGLIALDLAAAIARNAPLAVQASKRLAYRIVDGEPAGEAEMWAANDREVGALFASADAAEGPRAFAEKREPVWTGR
jgi:crotonobetainyl-CoA hydratase